MIERLGVWTDRDNIEDRQAPFLRSFDNPEIRKNVQEAGRVLLRPGRGQLPLRPGSPHETPSTQRYTFSSAQLQPSQVHAGKLGQLNRQISPLNEYFSNNNKRDKLFFIRAN